MYIDENNPNIFDDIFALLLHFNEYTSLIIFIEKKMRRKYDTRQKQEKKEICCSQIRNLLKSKIYFEESTLSLHNTTINALDTK